MGPPDRGLPGGVPDPGAAGEGTHIIPASIFSGASREGGLGGESLRGVSHLFGGQVSHLAGGRFFVASGAEKVRFSVTLSAGLLPRLDAVAESAGVTKSAVIETVLDRHLGSYRADAQKVRSTFSEDRDAKTARLQREVPEGAATGSCLFPSSFPPTATSLPSPRRLAKPESTQRSRNARRVPSSP